MSSRKALGRGLSALLPPEDDASSFVEREYVDEYPARHAARVGTISEVPVASVVPNPHQPRLDFDESALDELAASIRQLGIVQPITVRRRDDGFELITGERRLRAARKIGLQRIPAFVREADTEAMLEMALVENLQRESLNPIEVALGYQRLIDECGLTQERVALKVGKNRATVTNLLRLLRLPPRIQAAIRDGFLTAGHARALLAVESLEEQNLLLETIMDEDLSVREVEKRVRALQRKSTRNERDEIVRPSEQPPPLSQRDFLHVQQYQNRLRSHYGTQVQIRHKSADEGGRIEISYYSADDLERVLDLLLR